MPWSAQKSLSRCSDSITLAGPGVGAAASQAARARLPAGMMAYTVRSRRPYRRLQPQ